MSWNNDICEWGFNWKDLHKEWKQKQESQKSVRFPDSATNAIIYCSYLMTTSEEYMEEEDKGGYDSQDTDFISLSCFELLK